MANKSDDGHGELLIVADAKLATGLAAMLSETGLKIAVETSPVEAFNKILIRRPSLLVIDWKIRENTYDGLELLFNLRADDRVRHTPVLLIVYGSAWYRHEQFFQAIDFRPDDFLARPFAPSELSDKVFALLR